MTDLGRAAESAWNAHLESTADLRAEVDAFQAAVVEAGLVYGDRPAFTVYRPRFLDAEVLKSLWRETTLVVSALERAEDAILADPERLLPHLGSFNDDERAFLDLPRVLSRGDLHIRMDAARVADGFRFFELNGGVPGGIEFIDASQEVFRATPAYAAVASRHRLSGFDLHERFVRSVRSVWREFGGRGAPRVGIVDFLDTAGLIEEFRMVGDWLGKEGMATEIVDVRDLEWRDRRLHGPGGPLDLVYRRLTTFDMIERAEEVTALVDAARAGAVCMIDPLPQSTLDRKALFGFVTDPALDPGLTADERAACRRSVPWTRLLADRRTTDDEGREIDLLEHARAQRDRLILKPNHDYGGRGLHIGWEMDAGDWGAAIEEALSGEWVVQTGAVETNLAEYPPCEAPDTRVEFHESTDPYLFSGEFGGILTRLSRTTATNVTAGGSATPTFVVHD